MENLAARRAVFLTLAFGGFFGDLWRYGVRDFQNPSLIGGKEDWPFRPILHRHRDFPFCPVFGEIKIGAGYAPQSVQLGFGQGVLVKPAVLERARAALEDFWTVRPSRESRAPLFAVRSFRGGLRGRMAASGLAHFVQRLGEKNPGCRRAAVIVHRGGVHIGYLLIEFSLGKAKLGYLLKQALEVAVVKV